MQAKDFFQNQLDRNVKLNKRFQNLAARIAIIRVVLFIITILAFVYYINDREMLIALIILFVGTVGFILLIKKHNKLKFARDQYKFLIDINSHFGVSQKRERFPCF